MDCRFQEIPVRVDRVARSRSALRAVQPAAVVHDAGACEIVRIAPDPRTTVTCRRRYADAS